MSDVFEGYERQYCELSANLSRKCNSAALLLDLEQKNKQITELQAGLDEADVVIRKMDLEARSLQPSLKAMLLAKLREYKSDLNKLKREVKKLTSAKSDQALHEELLESGLADAHAGFLKMPKEFVNRPLFGGAVVCSFPLRFQNVSDVRQVPDHQEAFVDPGRDESLIFELLDLKHDVADDGSATWFFQDLASEQDAGGSMVIEQSGVFEADWLWFRDKHAVATTAVGQMAISKGRQGREAQNIVKVYLANLRLKEVGTDVLITAYEPLLINHLSESANAVGAGLPVPAAQSGFMPMEDVFKNAVSSFKVNDWSLFDSPA